VPVDYAKYPENWKEISKSIRQERAGGQCECTGQCGKHQERCPCLNYQPNPRTGSKVVLTVAHYPDPDPMNIALDNLWAMCQQCHNAVDAPMRAMNRASKKRAEMIEMGQMELL